MTVGSERGAVQNPFIRYAVDAGWEFIPRADALSMRGDESGVVFTDTLIGQLQELNPGVVNSDRAEELMHRLTRAVPTVEGNLDVWEHLRGIKTVFVEEEGRERDVRFVDADDLSANTFHVTDEFSFRARPDEEAIRFDVAMIINGVPIILVETKSAHKRDGVAEAIDQVRRYHDQGPEALAVLQLFGVTHIHGFKYGATWNTTYKALYDWREETARQLRGARQGFRGSVIGFFGSSPTLLSLAGSRES